MHIPYMREGDGGEGTFEAWTPKVCMRGWKEKGGGVRGDV